MFVRVLDKNKKTFFKSIVYGIINKGYYESYIVLNPITECFDLVDYLDKIDNTLQPLVEIINSDREGWAVYEKTDLLKFTYFCENSGEKNSIELYHGYEDIYVNFEFLLQLLRTKTVHKNDFPIKTKELSDINEWNYIRNQSDADLFLNLFAGFHDSTVNKIQYTEDYTQRTLIVTFDNSGWYGVAELAFEGLTAFNLRPAGENYSRELFSGCLIVKEECIFWADDDLKEEDLSYNGSYIKALNLKWRKIG